MSNLTKILKKNVCGHISIEKSFIIITIEINDNEMNNFFLKFLHFFFSVLVKKCQSSFHNYATKCILLHCTPFK